MTVLMTQDMANFAGKCTAARGVHFLHRTTLSRDERLHPASACCEAQDSASQSRCAPNILDAYEAERSSLGATVAGQANKWGADLRPILMGLDNTAVQRLEADAAARQALAARIEAVNRSEWESCGMQLGTTYDASPVIAYDESTGF
ncbi:hypothetical protein [Variovorax guangxiensis]|uniref:hypothetical protein n=1 Tax=Variovorax guangxiensis TaxID=1775474 RepID=UPI002865E60D|nr:hypothetical protein [Variovorax guangxiensis]MDR6860889.1 hypothetical protein [Variovorax guangxiensis]